MSPGQNLCSVATGFIYQPKTPHFFQEAGKFLKIHNRFTVFIGASKILSLQEIKM